MSRARRAGKKQRRKTPAGGEPKQPVRTCISCGGTFGKADLFRYTWGGSEPVLDPDMINTGRGVYSCKNERCSNKIFTDKKKWRRAFRLS